MGRHTVTDALVYGHLEARAAHNPTNQMPIYIYKTAAAFHIFEDWDGHKMQRKVGQFATWEQLLAAIRSEFQGRQIVPEF